mmetsp:Transcript_41392/g.119104  ORF Transcript_41392/g.119104 Transcript_41392/m.119104 type:complete len:217 (+) Transcript_41392:308-958(+)
MGSSTTTGGFLAGSPAVTFAKPCKSSVTFVTENMCKSCASPNESSSGRAAENLRNSSCAVTRASCKRWRRSHISNSSGSAPTTSGTPKLCAEMGTSKHVERELSISPNFIHMGDGSGGATGCPEDSAGLVRALKQAGEQSVLADWHREFWVMGFFLISVLKLLLVSLINLRKFTMSLTVAVLLPRRLSTSCTNSSNVNCFSSGSSPSSPSPSFVKM